MFPELDRVAPFDPKRRRRTTSAERADRTFFEARRDWSRWKHELLRRYLPKFAGILGTRYPTIYYVDGFAGAGSYNDPSGQVDGSVAPGSPLIASEYAATIAASQKWAFEVRCINVEVITTTLASCRLDDPKHGQGAQFGRARRPRSPRPADDLSNDLGTAASEHCSSPPRTGSSSSSSSTGRSSSATS